MSRAESLLSKRWLIMITNALLGFNLVGILPNCLMLTPTCICTSTATSVVHVQIIVNTNGAAPINPHAEKLARCFFLLQHKFYSYNYIYNGWTDIDFLLDMGTYIWHIISGVIRIFAVSHFSSATGYFRL